MKIEELEGRLGVIYWTVNVALLSCQRYIHILTDRKVFSAIFPRVNFDDTKITHTIEGHGIIFATTKEAITNQDNHNLYKGWQIALGITGMTSVLEYYLKVTAAQVSGTTCQSMGIFYRFEKITKIKLTAFEDYEEIRKYYEVRNISMHNLGRINQKFKDKTANQKLNEEAYVFYPVDLEKYRDLILKFTKYIEGKLSNIT